MNKAIQEKVIKKVLKTPQAKALFATTRIYKGKQYCTDAHRIFIFTTINDNVPIQKISDKEKPFELTLLGSLPKDYDFKIFLKVPSLDSLKRHLKQVRSNHKLLYEVNGKTAFYSFGENLPIVNEKHLIDILEVMPHTKLYIKTCKDSVNDSGKFIFGMDEDGNQCVLAPVINKIDAMIINKNEDEIYLDNKPKRRRISRKIKEDNN